MKGKLVSGWPDISKRNLHAVGWLRGSTIIGGSSKSQVGWKCVKKVLYLRLGFEASKRRSSLFIISAKVDGANGPKYFLETGAANTH